ncbi:MAG: hypothetical protein ACRC0J_22240 [Shewanella oncorhynchi]
MEAKGSASANLGKSDLGVKQFENTFILPNRPFAFSGQFNAASGAKTHSTNQSSQIIGRCCPNQAASHDFPSPR